MATRLEVYIWELRDGRPMTNDATVIHMFTGESEAECMDLLAAHRECDEFLDEALSLQSFEGSPLKISHRLVPTS